MHIPHRLTRRAANAILFCVGGWPCPKKRHWTLQSATSKKGSRPPPPLASLFEKRLTTSARASTAHVQRSRRSRSASAKRAAQAFRSGRRIRRRPARRRDEKPHRTPGEARSTRSRAKRARPSEVE